MIVSPGLAKRVAIAKGVGFLFGLVGFLTLPYFWPEADWMVRWGILLWYATLGGIIGLFGVSTPHPVLKMNIPWWILAPVLGAWMYELNTTIDQRHLPVILEELDAKYELQEYYGETKILSRRPIVGSGLSCR